MITGARWFAGRDCVGIVQVVEEHEKDTYRQTGLANFQYFIGVGKGHDEKEDMQFIADWGTRFDVAAGNTLFRVL